MKRITWVVTLVAAVYAKPEKAGPVNLFAELGETGVEGYFGKPGINFLSSSFQSGWHYSSKPYTSVWGSWGVSLGSSSLSLTAVEGDLLSFSLEGRVPLGIMLKQQLPLGFLSNYLPEQNPELNVKDLPTLFGTKSQTRMTLNDMLQSSSHLNNQIFLDSINSYNDAIKKKSTGNSIGSDLLGIPADEVDTIDIFESYHLPFFGLGIKENQSFPSGVNVNWLEFGASEIPVIDNVNLGVRFVPSTDLAGLEFSLFGAMLRHEFLGWFEKSEDRRLFASVQYNYNYTDFVIPEASVALSNHAWNLNISYDYSLFKYLSVGAFGSTGWEFNQLDVFIESQDVFRANNDGSQTLVAQTEEVDMSIIGNGAWKNRVGARISPLSFDLYYDYSFGVGFSSTHTLGFTLIGMNGI